MTGLVLLHGWGLPPELWHGWREAFSDRPVLVPEDGYSGPCLAALPENPDGWIGVGHSHGFARLLSTLPSLRRHWLGFVGFGAFLRFCRLPGCEDGTPPETIDAMLARLAVDPADVLARFARRSGLPKDSSAGGTNTAVRSADLAEGLRELRALDMAPPKEPLRTLLVHAADDRIVPVSLSCEAADRLPGATLRLVDGGGHALPFTRSALCIDMVREFLHGSN